MVRSSLHLLQQCSHPQAPPPLRNKEPTPAVPAVSFPLPVTSSLPPTNTLQVHRKSHRKQDSDSDDNDAAVKVIRDKVVEVDGKRYRVQGKGTYHNILIATASMRTLMEDGQLEKRTAYHGNYVHNYTAEVLLKGILRQTTLQSTLSGMQIHATPNHALKRLQQFYGMILTNCMTECFMFNGNSQQHRKRSVSTPSII